MHVYATKRRLLVVRLILTLVRFASLSVGTDLWGPLVASLLVENTQQTLLDIKLTSKWFGLPRTTLQYTLKPDTHSNRDTGTTQKKWQQRFSCLEMNFGGNNHGCQEYSKLFALYTQADRLWCETASVHRSSTRTTLIRRGVPCNTAINRF